ncbi:MAG: NAD+ synthase [Alphaproteobacteria bacterium]|nr:NAD+ synthase [Alphaproteobacteria bacterium]
MLIAQLNPIPADLDGNLKLIRWAAEQCPHCQGETLVLPAYALTGWPLGDLAYSKSFMAEVHKKLGQIYHNNREVLTAIPDGAGGATPVLLNAKGVHYGNRFTIDGRTAVVSVGFEPVNCEGADRLIVLDAKPFRSGSVTETLEHSRTFASRIRLPLVYTNLVGGNDSTVFPGGSFMLDQDGGFIECLPLWETAVAGVDEIHWPWTAEPENTWRALTIGLSDFVQKNGFKGVLLGLSGGFDSALCAAIAVDALGADKVRAVMMPSEYTSRESLDDAQDVAKALGIRYEILPIVAPVACYKQLLAPVFQGLKEDTTEENLQARLRGVLLMALSNKFGDLLLSTGNKSEASVGYATLYGDMCGGYAPINDLYKTDAYALAHWRNSNHPTWIKNDIRRIMPDRLITKAPTAELRPDQKDEDSLPAYETLDAILKMLVENDAGVEEIVAAGYEEAVVKKVYTLLHRSEFKRKQATPGIKLSRRSFNGEWSYPITKKV